MSSAPRDLLEATLPPSEGKRNLVKVLAYTKGAGTPAETQTMPEFTGQEYLDTSEGQFWKATGPGIEDWKRITSDNP